MRSSLIARRETTKVAAVEELPLPLDMTTVTFDPDIAATVLRALDTHRISTLKAQSRGTQTIDESAAELRRCRAAVDALRTRRTA